MRYALITGTGRSGTNLLLDSLDASPDTHCRNEPHGIIGAPLHAFPLVWTSLSAGSTALYRDWWDEVAVGTARRCGVRDHHFRYPKTYLHPWTNHLGLGRVMTGCRARVVASRFDRRFAAPEWDIPGWLGSRRRLEDGLGVLKILLDAPLLAWLLAERPEVKVVHVIRHPGGRLHSWLTRFVGRLNEHQREEQRVLRADHVHRIRSFDPRWRESIPDPVSLTLVQLELWFWRYVNETTVEAGAGHDSYRLMRFDDVAADPVGRSRELLEHVELDWTTEVERRITADASRSVFGSVRDPQEVAQAWRSQLHPDHAQTINEVMAGSPLARLLA